MASSSAHASQTAPGIHGFGRVLHVLNGLGFGGTETLCLQLMGSFPTEERLLLNIGPDGPMREKLLALPGCRIFDIPYAREQRAQFLWRVWRLLVELRPRGIIVYPFGLHLLIAFAARLAGVRRVLVHAGNPVPAEVRQREKWRWIVRASTLLGTPILSCSHYVDGEFRKLNRIVPRESRVIPNGIDTRAVRERAAEARAKRADSRPVVGMVARLCTIKDQETLIRAMPQVRAQHADAQAWIVGDGETREKLEGVARDLGLNGSVVFFGKRADVPELLGQMDVYVFSTTRDEGQGISLLEGMSAGLPLIASDVPPCREILEQGGGVLVPPKDPDALAQEITRFLADSGERERWGKQAQEVASSFSVERCAKLWLQTLTGKTADA